MKFNVMDKNLDKYSRPGIVQQTPPGISWIDPVGANMTLVSLKSLDCGFNYPFLLISRMKSLLVDFSSGGKRLSVIY